MMKKYTMILQLFSAAGLLMLCGCGPSAPEGVPPKDRNALVIRMFRSMEKKDAVSAAAQAAKVRTLDPGNAYFSWIIEVQECNQAMAEAQKAFDAGRFEDASNILEDARKRYPMQPVLATELKKIRQYQQFHRTVRLYSGAKDLAAREQALKMVTLQAAQLRDAALNQQCMDLRKQLDQEIARSLKKAPASPVRKP